MKRTSTHFTNLDMWEHAHTNNRYTTSRTRLCVRAGFTPTLENDIVFAHIK